MMRELNDFDRYILARLKVWLRLCSRCPNPDRIAELDACRDYLTGEGFECLVVQYEVEEQDRLRGRILQQPQESDNA